MIHEVKHGLQIAKLDAFQVQKWMLVRISRQYLAEKRATCGQDDFVRLQLLVRLADQRDVQKIFGVSDISECMADVGLEVIPLQAEFFRPHDEEEVW